MLGLGECVWASESPLCGNAVLVWEAKLSVRAGNAACGAAARGDECGGAAPGAECAGGAVLAAAAWGLAPRSVGVRP